MGPELSASALENWEDDAGGLAPPTSVKMGTIGPPLNFILLKAPRQTDQSTNKFVYEASNLIATLSAESQLLSSYVWGLDLTGTPQGAGGVGGLLSMTVHSGPQAGTYFYNYDGNGNVQALVNATGGTTAAQYEYGPFGEDIRASGPLARMNPFRFSTKYQDDESDFVYYAFRYYNPSTGSWLSRDPLEEHGAANLSSFVGNDAVNRLDLLGLEDQSTFVAKSFINGIPNVGSLNGRAGWNPGLGLMLAPLILPDFRKGPFLPLYDPIEDLSGQMADVRLQVFVAASKGKVPFNQNPATSDEDGEYRFYTRMTITASVCNSTPTVVVSSADMDGGQEIGPIYGTIEMSQDIKKTSDSVKVHWKGWGHPNSWIAEPGFQLAAKRSSINIWHEVTVKVSCNGGKPSFEIENFTGSSFPSHRLWQDGVLKKNLFQGLFSDLWQPDVNDPSFVRPRR
jgi:RHS repeat-associated protein